ncbi:LuxR C-terminal-related transcriptional regulator [Leucobacter musarum]|uniref:LuxR C-terminal-related transcriptional regulator n=1 Tax=Leucobacter musarum TaxID=1930747 RepID=UPI0009E6763C|nr:LuxR C-terminal-related transcriptional regulator [Leucobacter musarum]
MLSRIGFTGVPRVSRSLRRERLESLLSRGEDAALVTVIGPRGSGKTTLVSTWLTEVWREYREADATGVWISLENLSLHMELIWSRALASLQVQIQHDVDILTQLNDALDLASDFMLVIDNFELMLDQSANDQIEWLLSHSPRLRILLLTRSATELEHRSRIIQVGMSVIRFEDLKFTIDECQDLCKLRGWPGSREKAASIIGYTNGWPAAVRILAGSRTSDDSLTKDKVLKAFIETTLDEIRCDEELALALEHASVVSPSDVSSLRQVMNVPRPTANSNLRRIERSGTIVWREEGRNTFEVLDLIRDAILRLLPSQKPELWRRMNSRLIPILRERGDIVGTLRALFEVGNGAAITAFIIEEWDYLAGAEDSKVDRLLEGRSSPLISYLIIFRKGSGGRAGYLQELLHELELERRRHRGKPEYKLYSAVRVGLLRELGLFDAAATIARDALRDHDVDAPETIFIQGYSAWAWMQHALALRDVGRTEDARRAALISIDHSAGTSGYAGVASQSILALIQLASGQVELSKNAVADTRRRVEGMLPKPAYHLIAELDIASGIAALERFDVSGAIVAAERTLHEYRSLEVVWLRVLLDGWIEKFQLRGYSMVHSVSDFLKMETPVLPAPPEAHAWLNGLIADVLISLGRPHGAARLSESLTPRNARDAGPMSRILLFSGEERKALEVCERWLWRTETSERTRLELLLTKTLVIFRMGEKESALAVLNLAVGLSETHGVKMPYLLFPLVEIEQLIQEISAQRAPWLLDVPAVFSSFRRVPTLTQREQIVLEQLRVSSRLEEISRELMVSPNTVKTQIRSLYKKLGVSSRADALQTSLHMGLFPEPSSTEHSDARKIET